jgi:hypothetical protein
MFFSDVWLGRPTLFELLTTGKNPLMMRAVVELQCRQRLPSMILTLRKYITLGAESEQHPVKIRQDGEQCLYIDESRLIFGSRRTTKRFRHAAALIASMSNFARNGFFRYATQPTSKASWRVASSSIAVIKMTGRFLPDEVNRRFKSMPEIPPR